MQHQRHPSERPLPPISVYIWVSIVLAVVTAIEVAAFYFPVPGYILIPVFIVLSLLKFVLVIQFFMHLRYDHKLFSSFFTGGLLLAMGIVLGLITLFDNFDIGDPNQVAAATPPPTVIVVTPPPSANGAPPGPTDGPGIFLSRGCNGCHVIEGLAGAVGIVGPELTGIASRAGTRVAGLSAEEYIRMSVDTPEAFLVEGYDNVMQPLRATMSDEEFDTLVEYLLTLQ